MSWQFKLAVAKHFRPVNNRMHQNVLTNLKAFYIIPRKYLIFRKNAIIANHFVFVKAWLFVNIISKQHIHAGTIFHKTAKHIQNLKECPSVKPVITVEHLVIQTTCIGKTGIYCCPVAPVFLVNRPYNRRMFFLQTVGNFSRFI